MYRSVSMSILKSIMERPLPKITYQKRKMYRPSRDEILYTYRLINLYIFDNILAMPEITTGQPQKAWAYCLWYNEPQGPDTFCTIHLNKNWMCRQWFINTFAHEMVHQWQWDIYRPNENPNYNKYVNKSMGHGPSFFRWRDKFAEHGLCLKGSFGQKRWYKHQNFNKC